MSFLCTGYHKLKFKGASATVREYSEYVISKYNEWTIKYNIPEHMEFELKTMFELEEQFRNQPLENVKTKRDILDMIMHINGRFQGKLFEKKKDDILNTILDIEGINIKIYCNKKSYSEICHLNGYIVTNGIPRYKGFEIVVN